MFRIYWYQFFTNANIPVRDYTSFWNMGKLKIFHEAISFILSNKIEILTPMSDINFSLFFIALLFHVLINFIQYSFCTFFSNLPLYHRVNTIVSSDIIITLCLYENTFTKKPNLTLWILTNLRAFYWNPRRHNNKCH